MIRLFAVLASLSLLHGVKLEAKAPAGGDKADVQIESAIDLEVRIQDSSDKDKPQVRTSSVLRAEKFSHIVSEASDKGSTLKVQCTSSTLQRSGTNTPLTTEKTELDGKTFWVTRGASTTVKNDDGSAASAAAWSLGSWEDFGKLLPKGEVEIGATWAVDGTNLGGLLGAGNLGDLKSTVQGKLDAVDGDRATLSFTGNVTGRTAEGFEVKLTLDDCKMAFDKAKGRPQSFAVKATMEAVKKITQPVADPRAHKLKEEQIGEAKIKSSKFEVTVTYR